MKIMSNSKCMDFRKKIIDVVYGESSEEEIKDHIGVCDNCHEYYMEMQELRKGLKLPEAEIGEEEAVDRYTVYNIIRKVENTKTRHESIKNYLKLLAVSITYFAVLAGIIFEYGFKMMVYFQLFAGLQLPLLLIVLFSKSERAGVRR